MWDLVGNPEDRFSDVAAHIVIGPLVAEIFMSEKVDEDDDRRKPDHGYTIYKFT